jgi:molybdopterin-guanine dinucleotide biosynthesis protein MobB
MEKLGCVLLSGGRGQRMGSVNKAELTYKGKTFMDLIGKQLKSLGLPCFLSLAEYGTAENDGWQVIRDMVTDENGAFIGPMGGITSCLRETGLDGIFVVSCDMPLFHAEMAKRLLEEADRKKWDAVLWKTGDGRVHPVCAYYAKSCLGALEEAIDKKDYRLTRFLEHISVKELETRKVPIPDVWFSNVNCPDAYEKLKKRQTPVLAVSGRKNTGKTTLIEGLVRELSKSGVRTAVIKHDGHEFEPDRPGTDSFRIKGAGALGTVVYSARNFQLVKDLDFQKDPPCPEDFFSFFPEADLILLEGQKNSSYPKIEVMRREISPDSVCRPETVLAYVTDWKKKTDGKIPEYSFEDIAEISKFIILWMNNW